MANFRQKEFSEFDAMRSFYVELMKRTNGDRRKYQVINNSALPSILRGNNIVVEKFVISTSTFGKDRYRMYLKIGAGAKLPDDVKLPSFTQKKSLGNVRLSFNGGIFGAFKQKENSTREEGCRIKLFGGGGGGPKPLISAEVQPYIDVERKVQEPTGEVVDYNKKDRSLILEFKSIGDAIGALDILPFGMNYKIYLLDA